MSTLLNVYDKRARLWEEAKTFLETHQDENGTLSADDAAAYDKMMDDYAVMTGNIERLERHEKIEAQMALPTSQPIFNAPNDTKIKTGRDSDEYRQAVLNAFRTNFRQVSNSLQENVDSSGGYLVPDEWDRRLIKSLEEENVMRRLGTSITTSGEHKINLSTTRPVAYWVAEGATITASDAAFAQKTLDAHKMAVLISVTNELLADNAYDLESHIVEEFGKTLANLEEDAFLNGDGNGKPTGLLTTATADSDTVRTTSGANISADDIIDLIYDLKRPYRKNAAFILNDKTLSVIRKLKDANQGYVWQPSYQAGEPDRLLGYPVYTSAYFPTIKAGDPALAFGDFSYYNIGDRGTRSFQELREKFAETWSTGFMMVERVDGLLLLPEAVRVLKIKA